MPIFLIVTIFYGVLISFISNIDPQTTDNPLFSFAQIQYDFISANIFLLFLIVAFSSFLFFIINFRKEQIIRRYIVFARDSVVMFFFGILSSFLLLFVIAFVEMNVLALLTNISPRMLGVTSETQSINDILKSRSSPPEIVIGSEDENLLKEVAYAQSGRESFFGRHIVSNIPDFLVLPTSDVGEGILMVGNTLIISEIDSTAFQQTSPVVSHLLIKRYFPDRNIKSYPELELMSENEYQEYRQKDFANKVNILDELVVDLDEKTASLSATIQQQQQLLEEQAQEIEQAREDRESEYIQCRNEGFYQEDEFVRINTKEDCEEQLTDTDAVIDELNEEFGELKELIAENEERLKQYEAYVEYYTSQKTITQESSAFVSYEFAAFEPPDKIRIALDEQTTPQSVADFLVLLVHEYLHYTVYEEEGDRLQSAFFVEGLTEYFARNIIESGLEIETNLAYPANVKIINQFSKRIPESDLADIYFSSDQEELERVIDLVYEDGFYDKNIIVLETLHYSANPEKIIGLANGVMNEIGGDPLSVEDLQTTHTKYR